MTFLTFSNTEGLFVSKQTLSVIVPIFFSKDLEQNHSVMRLRNKIPYFLSSREIFTPKKIFILCNQN